jgi:uncharacterized protein (TIGR02265 family)
VPQRTFEALLIGVGRPPELEERLRQLGYAPQGPDPAFPLPLWRSAAEASRLHAYDHLSQMEGQRQLGRKMMLGAQMTPVGWAVAPALAELEPERFLARLGWSVRPWRPGMRVEVREARFRDYRLDVGDPSPAPEVFAGALEFWFLQQRQLVISAQVEEQASSSYLLRIRW